MLALSDEEFTEKHRAGPSATDYCYKSNSIGLKIYNISLLGLFRLN